MKNDEWAVKIFNKLAVLIVSYPGQRAYLKFCVETHSKLGLLTALSYDNYVNPENPFVDHNLMMPQKEVLDRIDLFLMPHHQTWGDTDYPFFWALKWGANALKDFEYVYCVNGDFVLEKPEGFHRLLEIMGDSDMMTSGPDASDCIANGAFIIRSKWFLPMVQFIQDTYIPFPVYESHVHRFGNCENRMAFFVQKSGLKLKSVPKPLIWDDPSAEESTWTEVCGLRHIHGELDYAFKKRLVPPHYKYLDERYLLPIYNYRLIKKYWDTQDEIVLKEWWVK